MEASELRIGNLLKYKDKEIKVGGLVEIEIFGWQVLFDDFEMDLDKFSPIPLTEDWLVKFGFEFSFDSWELIFGDKSCFDIDKWYDDSFHFVCNSGDTNCNIKYVHQLQNLYFAITGEELKIK